MVKVGTTLDVYVSESYIVEVHRGAGGVVAQKFACDANFEPKVFLSPIHKSKRFDVCGWIVPVLFVAGVIGLAWLVMR